MKKFLAIFLTMLFLFAHTTAFADVGEHINDDEDGQLEEENSDNATCCSALAGSSENVISLCSIEDILVANQENTVQFSVEASQEVLETYCESEGINIISYNYENGFVSVKFTYNGEETASKLTVGVLLEDETVLTANMYVYSSENNLFISGVSSDDAFEKYCSYLLNNQLIDENEYKTILNTYYKQSVIITTNTEPAMSTVLTPGTAEIQAKSKTTYLNGVIVWVDDNSEPHFCQHVRVDVYDKEVGDPKLIATTYTDSNGYYSVTFENNSSIFELGGYDIYIEVFAGGTYGYVKKPNGGLHSISTVDEVIENVDNGSTSQINLKFVMNNSANIGGDLGRAFQISQPISVASKYAEEMNGSAMSEVSVVYPADGTICAYNDQSKTIKIISGYSENENVINAFEAWDVIMHEYGHHVQHEIGIANSPKGPHDRGENSIDKEEYTDEDRKDKGTRLAWAESWPTVFGIMAQQYYISELQNIDTVGDENYTANNGLNYSVETEEYSLGEGSEDSIMYLLYDLYDAYNENDPHDTVELSHYNMWAYVKASQAVTLSEFIQYLYENELCTIDGLGKLLSKCGMSATNLTVVSGNTPTFTWDGYGGSVKEPYDKYEVVIATSTKELLRINTGSAKRCILTNYQWKVLRDSGSNVIKWRVLSSGNRVYPSTGPYSTAWHTFNLPEITTITINSATQGNISSSGDYNWYKFVAPAAGYYKFYTEGTTDTIGELFEKVPMFDGSCDGSLMYNDDGHVDPNGNVANMGIVYELHAGQIVYLKVSAYSTFTGSYVVFVNQYNY